MLPLSQYLPSNFFSNTTLSSDNNKQKRPESTSPNINPSIRFNFGSECSICLDDLSQSRLKDIKTLPCQHQFHRQCIDTWLTESLSAPTCPMCKCDLSKSNALPVYAKLFTDQNIGKLLYSLSVGAFAVATQQESSLMAGVGSLLFVTGTYYSIPEDAISNLAEELNFMCSVPLGVFPDDYDL